MTQLRDALARKKTSKTDKYLLIVAHHDGPIPNAEIKSIAHENGWKEGAKSAPASFLSKSASAILVPSGWTITAAGRADLEQRGLIATVGVLTPVTEALERYVLNVRDADKARFIEEAIVCVRNKSFRAAIVLGWVGAVYLLYAHVIANHRAAFNAEMKRRFPRKNAVTDIDDLASAVKEAEFLNILEHISVITDAQFKELSSCLDRRNTAGHPNSHAFTEIGAGNHLETLIKEVYSRY